MFNKLIIPTRKDWQEKVDYVGMHYHTIDGKAYWNENSCYELSTDLVDKIEDATTELHSLCIEYVADVIRSGDYDSAYNFDDYTKSLIEQSWNNIHPSVYGRFDFGIDDNENIKMFEYNADTPTGLLEASVVQWNWKEEVYPRYDQFNSIDEKLIEYWKSLAEDTVVHFSAMSDAPYEDWGNVNYLAETAYNSGLNVSVINLEEIGYDSSTNSFVDMNHKEITTLFKLYPWEWMRNDGFYNSINKSKTLFMEPPWKMLLSDKLLCVKLWERHPNHPLLLESYLHSINQVTISARKTKWISKPLLGREGQGVVETDRPIYGNADPYIIQEKMNVKQFQKIQPVIGSWVINNQSAGIGIREDLGITTNNSCFVPHYFR